MNIADKTTGSSYTGAEFTEHKNEIANAIDSSGQLAAANALQLKQAIARYVANGFFFIDSGAADAYVLSPIANYSGKTNDAPSAYLNNQVVMFVAGNTNTGAATVNIASCGVKSIKKTQWSVALGAGDIVAGKIYCLVFNTVADCFELIAINDAGGVSYTLPTATGSVLGGVKVGTTLEINAGVLDVLNPITEYGTVKADGSKLVGTSGWTVSKNSTGNYQLVLPSGDYVVVVSQASPVGVSGGDETLDTVSAVHSTSTGLFSNNTSGNVQGFAFTGVPGDTDLQWTFYAIKM